MGLTLGIIFGIISMLGFGLGNAISQVPAKAIGSKRTIFFKNIFVSLFLSIVLLFFISKTSFSLKYMLIAFGISFIGYIAILTLLKALKVGKVGVIMPIADSSVIFTVLFSILFFKEALTAIQFISILIIIGGIILISTNFKDKKSLRLFTLSSGIPLALITCIVWGLMIALLKIPITILGPILTSLIIELGVLIFSGINLKLSKSSFNLPNKKILIYIIIIALFGGVGTLFLSLGIKMVNVSIIAAIISGKPLVSTLYGKFAYKEKLTLQQYLAIPLIIIGIIIISI